MTLAARWALAVLILALLSVPALAEGPDLYEKARETARTLVWKDLNSGRAGSASVAVMVDGQLVYSEGFGMADREKSIPVDARTLFNMGSISKVFTAAAIMLLVDDGRLALDDPVVKHLPDFRMADPRYRDITVRMLLDHSSGLPGSTGANDFGFRYNPDVFRQVLTNLSHLHLKHPPGAKAPYTNDGFTLAEMIVERVSGQRFVDFLAARVFGPLSMPDTGVGVGERPDRIAARFYDPETARREPLEALSLLGAGGLSTTAEDLCRFQDSFSGQGPQILSAASLAEMRKEQPSGFRGKLRHSDLAFGLGWDMTDLPPYRARGLQVMGKSGGTGRYTTFMFTAPEHRISVAVLETAQSGNALGICKELLDEVLVARGLWTRAPEVVERPLAHQPIPPALASYAGYYAPFQKISFDLGKNVLTLTPMGFGQEPRPQALFYHGGYFHDAAGQKYFFQTVEGEDYFLRYRPDLDVDMLVGQKLKRVARPLALRIPMAGARWLVRTSKWWDGVQGTGGHLLVSRTFPELPGYLEFGGLLRVQSPDFAGMPVDNVRDLFELTLLEREGQTWARLSESLYSPASSAPLLRRGSRTIALGPDGASEWLRLAEGLILSFQQPGESRVLVFSADGEPLYDSALESGSFYAARGCFVEFLGAPGAEFRVEGR